MSRLPQPGADKGTWGDILNDFLSQSHNADGSIKAAALPTLTTLGGITPAQVDTKIALQAAVDAGVYTAATENSFARPAVKLGASIPSGTLLSDFQALNTAYAPRRLDFLMFFQDLDGSTPIWWSGYPTTYAGSLGAMMYVTWSPPSGTLTSAAALTSYLQGEASRAAAYGKPVVVRLAHEFNGGFTPYGSGNETAAQFVTAWQTIVNIFRSAGANNVLWCWCPNSWGGELGGSDPSAFYPGDDYVDIVAVDGYMNSSSVSLQWPADIFSSNYNTLCSLSSRPFMIGEVGVEVGESRVVAAGGRSLWFQKLFALIKDMPRCIAVNLWERDAYVTNGSGDTAARAAVVAGINASPLVPSPIAIPTQSSANTWLGKQTFSGGLTLTGATTGQVPVSDASGNLTAQAIPSPAGKTIRCYFTTGTQAYTSGGLAIQITNTEINDDTNYFVPNFHSAGTNPDTITVVQPGLYLISANAYITGATANAVIDLILTVGGTTVREVAQIAGTGDNRLQAMRPYRITTANTLVQMKLYGTAACTINGSSNKKDTGLEITYLGS